ncbi:DUF4870 domain-containing protein [Halomarina litorea]|uniref:DUF4870 domain-containing protein n=1 Tax=Halomarina litorea TaxID=2961595 RepID=UPI0020C46FBD|nr:DUF4870 domain-containing protein [Halomarina sp. BCD28]
MATTERTDHADAESSPTTHTTTTHATTDDGPDANLMGALSYVLGFVTGIVVYLVEKEDEFVRFHAAQSIAVSAILFGVSIALSVVGTAVSAMFFAGTGAFAVASLLSLLLGLVWLAVSLVGFVLWVYLIVRAYQGTTPRIPVAAGLADRMV